MVPLIWHVGLDIYYDEVCFRVASPIAKQRKTERGVKISKLGGDSLVPSLPQIKIWSK